MKRYLILLLSLFCFLQAAAQKKTPVKRKPTGHGVFEASPQPEILVTVSQMAEFPGGMSALREYFQKNIRYPAAAREDHIQGTVIIRFLLGDELKPSRMEILKDIGGGCGKEVCRALNSITGWKPGRMNGRVIPTVYVLKTQFRLRQE